MVVWSESGVARPVYPFQHVAKEAGNVVRIDTGRRLRRQ